MKTIARTLLILSSVGACERAAPSASSQPVVDLRGRPAVGNLGQTGRPAARPLVGPEERPTGAPDGVTPRVRPRDRAVRPRAQHPTRPAVAAAVGSMPRVVLEAPQGLALSTGQAREPLLTRERRPAAGNVMRKCGTCGEERDPEYWAAVAEEFSHEAARATTEAVRRDLISKRDHALRTGQQLAHEQLQERR